MTRSKAAFSWKMARMNCASAHPAGTSACAAPFGSQPGRAAGTGGGSFLIIMKWTALFRGKNSPAFWAGPCRNMRRRAKGLTMKALHWKICAPSARGVFWPQCSVAVFPGNTEGSRKPGRACGSSFARRRCGRHPWAACPAALRRRSWHCATAAGAQPWARCWENT